MPSRVEISVILKKVADLMPRGFQTIRSQQDKVSGVTKDIKLGLVARKLDFGACKQQRYRPDCASAYADQCRFYSHFVKYYSCKISYFGSSLKLDRLI